MGTGYKRITRSCSIQDPAPPFYRFQGLLEGEDAGSANHNKKGYVHHV
jgi:hypothetical protein